METAIWRSTSGHVPLISAAQARAGDTYAIDNGDTPAGLMWRAAGHLARGIIAPRASGYGMRVVIIVGRGNNGGDGYAAALRLTREYGAKVSIVALDGVDVDLSDEADAYRAKWLAGHGTVITTIEAARSAIGRADVVVDAVLGTGASGPLRGMAAPAVALLAFAHTTGVMLVACDLPTGVDADTGVVAPHTVPVTRTITFGAAKRGMLLTPGGHVCGQVAVASLGPNWDRYVHGLSDNPDTFMALTATGATPEAYRPDADKWSRGRVGVLAGVHGTAGASVLCANGALQAGAGLISVYAAPAVANELAGTLDPAVMLRRLDPSDTAASGVAQAAWVASPTLARTADVVVAGPGLGVTADVRDTVLALLSTAPRLVLDADALNVMRDDPTLLGQHAGVLVLTPHRKELARIGGGVDGDDAHTFRADRVPQLARTLDATIVAKGPATLIAAPDGRVWVTPVGSPAAGTGGSGDLLAGMIAAAIATADDVSLAVAKAVWWHAWAAERAGLRCAGRASANDIRAELGPVLGALAAGPRTLSRPGGAFFEETWPRL